MNTRIEQIVRQADGAQGPALPADQAATAAAHRELSGLLKQAYAGEPADARLAFMAGRVLARAKAAGNAGIAARLGAVWHMLTRHYVLACAGTAVAMLLAVSATMVSLRPAAAPAVKPSKLRSFANYETPDGSGFIRCFEYEHVSQPRTGNGSS